MALNKHGVDWKAIDRDQKAIDKLPNKGRAKHTALKEAATGKKGFDHEQHAKHNRRIEEIDRKAGIGRFDPKRYK